MENTIYWTADEYLRALSIFIQSTIENQDGVVGLGQVDDLYANRANQPDSERLGVPESYFTAHFVLRALRCFHESNISRLGLRKQDISNCLRAESHERSFLTDDEGKKLFAFSPATTGKKHLMNKKDVAPGCIPPNAKLSSKKYQDWGYKSLTKWRKGSGLRGSHFSVCPDFAIGSPSPYTVVGEVKIVRYANGKWTRGASITEDEVRRIIFDLTKEVIFYLGCHVPHYEFGMLVVADATRTGIVKSVIEDMHPDLVNGRFGSASGLYLTPISLD